MQTLNNALLENNCSEQASRMSAMESSTKNAKEMLDKLTLSYNRCPAAPLSSANGAVQERYRAFIKMCCGGLP